MELNSLCHSNDELNYSAVPFTKRTSCSHSLRAGSLCCFALSSSTNVFILVFKRCCHQIQTSQLTAVFETCHVSSSLCHVPDENSAFVGSARPLAVNQLFFLVSFKDFCSVLGLKTSIMVNLAIDFWGLNLFWEFT